MNNGRAGKALAGMDTRRGASPKGQRSLPSDQRCEKGSTPAAHQCSAVGVPTREDGAGNGITGCDAPRVVKAHPLSDERKARPTTGCNGLRSGERLKNSPMYDPAVAAPRDVRLGQNTNK